MRKKGSQFIEGGLGLEDLHPSLGGNRVPEHLSGEVSAHVMARAGIEFHEPGTRGRQTEPKRVGYDYSKRLPAKDEPLHSTQRGLSARTLQVYGSWGAPTEHPLSGTREPYLPELVTDTYEGGKEETFIMDGHHRIITNRLGNNRVNEADE